MATKTLGSSVIDIDDLGYMKDFSQWDKDIGTSLAKDLGIDMTDRHWAVIGYIQDEYKKGTPLTIRKITKSGVVDTKEFYALFPEGPLKKASLIAGIPKPVGCV